MAVDRAVPGASLSRLEAALGAACTRRLGEVVVSGVRHDSRDVCPGDLFVGLVGGHHDGHEFMGDALQRGAAALVALESRAGILPKGVPALLVSDTRVALALCSAEVYGDPSHDMRMVLFTGTNGKTTSTAMLASIVRASGLNPGRIGTLGAQALGQELPCEHTTPEADDLQRILYRMRSMGVDVVAMEASSHGLALRRTDRVAVSVGVFTNLTQDHLDFHGDLDEYFRAKLRLFTEYPEWSQREFVAAVNTDDPRGTDILAATSGRKITFGCTGQPDLRATGIRAFARSTEFEVDGLCGRLSVRLPIGGVFQVANALGALAAAVGLGITGDALSEGLASMEPVPGRFESVETGRGWDVIVDFAHTPAGLESLLASARALKPRRILLVVGCGGNRDRGKRPIIGALAGHGADVAVITSDNPRHEDPQAILDDMLAGMGDASAKVIVQVDRREATRLALRLAEPGDLVLIAGKGGEVVTLIGDERIPYDDRVVVREYLEETA